MPQDQKIWTIIEILKETQGYFAGRGIPSHRLDAELLLAHCLGKDRLRLYLDFDSPLTGEELSRFRELVRRRGRREPVAYILGYKDFWSLRLRVSPDVLIPRPETEVLIEQAVCLLKQESIGANPRILDIGTGSGAIALALARELPGADIAAIDVSAPALEIARMNAVDCCAVVRFAHADGLSATGTERFDCVVSNPPYIPTRDIDALEPEIRLFEPRVALDGGADGLDFYRSFIPRLPALLHPGGAVYFEMGHDQGAAITEMLGLHGLRETRIFRDYAAKPRVICARMPL